MSQTQEDNTPFQVVEDPFTTIRQWLDEAKALEPNNPEAMSLATVDEAGMPNVRIVLMRGLDVKGSPKRGLVFYTNFESAKSRELAASPKAALLFYWKSLGRQIRLRGLISPVSPQEADAYFATRPEGSRIGAWASEQSRSLDNRETLEKRVAQFSKKFEGGAIPRPPHWSGYRLTPLEIEFWKSGEFRLHHRLVYRREVESDPWSREFLYP